MAQTALSGSRPPRRPSPAAILEEALLEARLGEGRFLVLSGEAGIGKTRWQGSWQAAPLRGDRLAAGNHRCRRALLLVVEDVHWADASSRELLDHLTRRLAGLSALVLVTYRSDELHRTHPLLPTLQSWRPSGLAEVVELGPLTAAGVGETVRFWPSPLPNQLSDEFPAAAGPGKPAVADI